MGAGLDPSPFLFHGEKSDLASPGTSVNIYSIYGPQDVLGTVSPSLGTFCQG